MSEPKREPPVPEHTHVYDWEDDGFNYESSLIGVRCSFTYVIPPGPRGKKPRERRCYEFMDMDAALSIINTPRDAALRARFDALVGEVKELRRISSNIVSPTIPSRDIRTWCDAALAVVMADDAAIENAEKEG